MSKYNQDILNHYGISKESKTAGWGTLRDRILQTLSKYHTEIVVEIMHLIKAEGIPLYRPRATNTVTFGSPVKTMMVDNTGGKKDTITVMIYGKEIQDKKFVTKDVANMDPKAVAAWIW